MAKLIYVHNDDGKLLDTLLSALTENGYTFEHASSEVSAVERIHADMAFVCTPHTQATRCTVGDLTLDLDRVTAYNSDGQTIHFTPIEFAMLAYLMKNVQRAVPRTELLSTIWGLDNVENTRVVDDTAKRLRRKLKDTEVALVTVWNYGFRIQTK